MTTPGERPKCRQGYPAGAGVAPCRHCRRGVVWRPRGLCWTCYYAPGVRTLYPPGSANPATAKYVTRAVTDPDRPAAGVPLPAAPTTAAPGTREKLAVMEARALAGTQVFHPWDAAGEGDPAPLLFWAA